MLAAALHRKHSAACRPCRGSLDGGKSARFLPSLPLPLPLSLPPAHRPPPPLPTEALLAVDDMIEAVIHKLRELGELDNTYIL